MAAPKTASGTKMLIQVGDGADPEVFDTAMTCAAVTKSISFTVDSNTIVVPDCDNPDDPAWNQTEVTALGMEIQISGVLKTDAGSSWFDWMKSGAAKTVRANRNIPAADGGGYYAAAMKVTAYSETGERGNKIQMEATLVSDGAVTWTDAS